LGLFDEVDRAFTVRDNTDRSHLFSCAKQFYDAQGSGDGNCFTVCAAVDICDCSMKPVFHSIEDRFRELDVHPETGAAGIE
tara:strand:- start:925 stop:1167 length:243 start_codon:yes stop_codon:yes gene_type:complete